MPIAEIEALDKDAADAQVKAAISACIAQEIRNGRSRDQAIAICYAMARERIGKKLAEPEETA